MTVAPNSHPLRKTPLFTPYVVIWSMLGALSFGFLMVLGITPEWLDDLKPASTIAFPQGNEGQRAAARMAADLGQLKDSVAQIQLDLSKVKTDVELQGEQHKAVTAQVAALETRVSDRTQTAARETAVPAAPDPTPLATSESTEASKQPARTANVINAVPTSEGAALETGSVSGQVAKLAAPPPAAPEAPLAVTTINAATDTISFGPAVVKPTSKPVGLKLSTGASVDSLRLSWSLLTEKHGDKLGKLEPRYIIAGDDLNQTYDLVAGPINSKAEAAKVCKALIAKGVPCSVGPFTGDEL